MKKTVLTLGILLLLVSCSSTKNISKNVKHTLKDNYAFLITEIATDRTYGFSSKNPVEVGGAENEGPLNERRFLNALAGPNGEEISYKRAGSCCPIKSKKAMFGNSVLLDNYRVTWEGSKDTVSIYINMYDSGILQAPVGFTLK
jgi:hypothetical protein